MVIVVIAVEPVVIVESNIVEVNVVVAVVVVVSVLVSEVIVEAEDSKVVVCDEDINVSVYNRVLPDVFVKFAVIDVILFVVIVEVEVVVEVNDLEYI